MEMKHSKVVTAGDTQYLIELNLYIDFGGEVYPSVRVRKRAKGKRKWSTETVNREVDPKEVEIAKEELVEKFRSLVMSSIKL